MNRKIILLLVLALTGCEPPNSPKLMTWTAEKNVASQLKDPSSAKFSDEFIVIGAPKNTSESQKKITEAANAMGETEFAVCGYVNGKNSFGAMSGKSRFVAYGMFGKDNMGLTAVQIEDLNAPHVEIYGRNQSAFDASYWNSYCVDDAHAPIYSGER